MATFIQHPVTRKFITAAEYEVEFPGLRTARKKTSTEFQEFVSPIDKTVISDRGQLAKHNAKHNVTSTSDFSPEFLAKRTKARDDEMTGNTPQAKQERLQVIHETLNQFGV